MSRTVVGGPWSWARTIPRACVGHADAELQCKGAGGPCQLCGLSGGPPVLSTPVLLQEGTSILSRNRTSQSGTKEGRGRPPSPAQTGAERRSSPASGGIQPPGTQDPDAPQGRGREGAAAVNARPRRCRAVGKLVQYLPASRPLVLAPRMFGCNYCTGCVTVSPKVHIWGVLRSW